MKHGYFKQILSAVLSAVLLLTGCTNSGRDPGESNAPGTDEPNIFSVAENGKSDYVIVVDITNETEKAFAKSLQVRIQSLTGATLPLRSATGSRSDREILIGNTGRQESTELIAELAPRDFAWRVGCNGGWVMATTDEEMYSKLETVLERTLFAEASGSFTVQAGSQYLFHQDIEKSVFSEVDVVQNGRSDFVLVYGLNEDISRKAANAAAAYIERVSGIRFQVKSDESRSEKEILLGTPNRDLSDRVYEKLKDEGTYGICAQDNTVAVCGKDRLGTVHAIYRFAQMLSAHRDQFTLRQAEDILSMYDPEVYAVDVEECVQLYQEMFGTFSSYVAWKYARMPESERNDQTLIDAMLERMGNSVALWLGSSTALYNGFYIKLDPTNYSLATKEENGHIRIAKRFAGQYLGTGSEDPDGYVDLTAFCESHPEYSLFRNGNSNLILLTPASVEPFANLEQVVNGYSNRTYLERMERFFTDPTRRDPQNDTEQTRVVITEAPYDSSAVYDYTVNPYPTNYSPGICVTQEDGKEVLYVSYETCMVTDYKKETDNTTYLKRSCDGGENWELLGTVEGMRWACIFQLEGKIYLIGTHVQTYHAMVAEYSAATGNFRWKDLGMTGGIGGANPVLIANGKIYKASGDRMMTADVGDDLLNRESWSFSKQSASQFLTKDWFRKATGAPDFSSKYALGEGSVLTGPDGKIYVIFRIDAGETCSYAAIVEVSADGSTLSAVPSCNSLIRMPTSTSKFSVRYDAVSGLYLSMTSLPTLPTEAAKQRNILGLIVSRDLIHWDIADVLLVDRELMNNTLSAAAHGFQYVDFDFSGDSLRLVVREAVGHTNTYHDGTYITMYTVKNFRALIARQLPELFEAAGRNITVSSYFRGGEEK